ncbi:MAG: phosphatidylglycerol lysyltransferase domain-containing protein [Desulfarculales bacterium]|jgi:hypothetical protein|nr:phosphatidylglycerol lysyltransferase domain-containing protein [Desulfarculales bacterium]
MSPPPSVGEEDYAFDGVHPLTLADKPYLDIFFKQDNPLTSELTFTNLFMWQDYYRPRWRVHQDCLLIWLRAASGRIMLLPPLGTGDKTEAVEYGFKLMASAGIPPCLGRAGQDLIDNWLDKSRLNIEERRNQADYVYLSQDLIDLKGNRFHRKKNHLNRFLKTCPHFVYRKITPAIIEQVQEFQDQWSCRRQNREGIADEHRAVMLALDNFSSLDCDGAAIFLEKKVVAYSLGEALNHNTAVIHVEKADSLVNGAYVAINQMFCQNRWSCFTFINREQDMGLPGLRAAKESYYPHHMVNKFTVTTK